VKATKAYPKFINSKGIYYSPNELVIFKPVIVTMDNKCIRCDGQGEVGDAFKEVLGDPWASFGLCPKCGGTGMASLYN
jgi:hypothetical protein